jgi:hypothetical protein
LQVIGRGWEGFDRSRFTPERFPGSVRQNIVAQQLSQAVTCPVVSHSPGFYTGKPFVVHACGAVPVLYGRGADKQSHTWDPRGIYEPLDSEFRVTNWDELKRVSTLLHSDGQLFEQLRTAWSDRLQPRFDKLDRLIDDLIAGRDMTTREWYADYGGYEPV